MTGPETAGVAVADAWGLGVGLGTAVAVLTDDGLGWNEKGAVDLAGPVKNDPPRKSPETRTAQVTSTAAEAHEPVGPPRSTRAGRGVADR